MPLHLDKELDDRPAQLKKLLVPCHTNRCILSAGL